MNSYNYSYNVLINRLEAFAAGHLLIKRFTHGQIDLADMDQNEQYPFMHVVPNNIKPVEGGMQFDFQILFADIPRDKETKAEYQREVISDCVRLAQDLIAEVKNGLILFGFDVQLVTSPVIEPFVEEYKNTLTGVSFSLQLEVPWDWSACDIPAVWSVGGTSSGGTGNAYGITLKTNGVNNAVQNILDLVAGTNITITDNGDGSVTFDADGGGGPSVLVSTEFNVNHTTATGNQYVVGDRVWYQGNVYACIANNDALLPTNTLYWTLQGAGFRLRQSPVDWNASSGDYQILNKPTIPAAQVNSDWNSVSGVSEILNKPTIPAAQVNSDWNAVAGVAEILNKPTIPAAQVNSDWNAVGGVAEILNKPTIPSPQGFQDVIITDNELTQNSDILGQGFELTFQSNERFSILPNSSGIFEAIVGKLTPAQSYIKIAEVDARLTTIGATTQQFRTDTTTLYIQTPAVYAGTAANGQVLTLANATTGAVEYTTVGGGGGGTVTSVATAGLISGGPITTSGTITTAMSTNKLVGRATAGSGIMEEITIGSGLTLTGAGVLNNTATPTPTGYYGAWQDVTTQSAAVNNTGYAMKFGTIDIENQVRMVSDGSALTRITFDNTGIYNLNFSVQIQNTDNAEHDVTIWIRKNGVDVAGSAGYVTVPKRRSVGAGLEGHTIAGWNYLLSVVGGEYYQIMWSTTQASAVTLQFYAAGSPPPSTASTLCIVTQQAGIMAGTGITAINSLTGAVQTIGVGTSGTDFAVSSSGTAHTFNLPTASAANRGALSSADWSTFNGKQDSIGLTTVGTNLATLPNPSAVRYLRINADNTVSALTLAQLKTDLSVGTDISVVLAADVLTVGTGFEDVTGLSFAVTAGKTYKWRATIRFAMTSGTAIFSSNGPTASINNARFTLTTAATTNGITNQTAYDTGTNVVVASSGLATADGIVRVTASGTWTIRFRSSIGGNFRAGSGSVLEYSEVL